MTGRLTAAPTKPLPTYMTPVNEYCVTVLAHCYQCDGHLDPADVPWLECEPCGRAWLVGESIIERIDLPDDIKGRNDVQHPAITVVMWDGTREDIDADDEIPLNARSIEFMFARRATLARLASLV